MFIAEDSAIMRERLVALLAEFGDRLEVVGQTGNATEATQAICRLKPDAVILDIQLRDGSGVEVLTHIKRHTPAPVVMMLTNYPYPEYRRSCTAAGADYFLDKSSEFEKVREIFEAMLRPRQEVN